MILKLPLYMFVAFYITWIFYLAVMNLKRARDAGSITKVAYRFGLPLLYIGLLIDLLVNVIFVTILFLEIPKECLITQRLKRHANGPDGWRRSMAIWLAKNLLDTFDPSGVHVKIDPRP